MKEERWEDLWMTATFENKGHFIEFAVYQWTGLVDGDKNKIEYEKIGATGSEDTTVNLSEAQPLVKGSVKFDSCSHLYFGEEGYIHGCSPKFAIDFGEALQRVYNHAKGEFKEHAWLWKD